MAVAGVIRSVIVPSVTGLVLWAGFAHGQELPKAEAARPAPVCSAPAEYLQLAYPLQRTALALAMGEPLRIVAIGSSSTAGAGASSPAASYPSRLEAELQAHYPRISVTVLNRGVNGEEAPEMLARFDASVLSENPDLVLWQVGTNAVLRDENLATEAPLIRDGIRRLKAAPADVVLIDPQFAPKVLAKPDVNGMVDLIGNSVREEKVNLFQRFAIMRHWREVDGVPFDQLLSPDGLHMNDWSYACIAKLLGASIAGSVQSSLAGMSGRRR